MQLPYIEDKIYDGINSTQKLAPGKYDHCTFTNSNLSKLDLFNFQFIDCVFEHCDLSLANIANTAFREVQFKHCKLLGLHFEDANPILFAVRFDACQLNLSSFYQRALKNTPFKDCSLQEVDFTEADLTNARFDNCDLSGAIFEHTNLEKADFRTAYHYSIHPEVNKIKKAKFSIVGIVGLLEKYDIEVE